MGLSNLSETRRVRLITFANNSLKIEYEGRESTKIIDILYQYVPANDQPPPHLTYHLLSTKQAQPLQLYREDVKLYAGDSVGTAAEFLLGDTCYHLAAHSRNGLLFHAAGLAWQGRGLLLPGASRAGKSTLAAWLSTKGFDYLTDELVFVEWGTNTLQCLTRPLNLKHPSRAVLKTSLDFTNLDSQILSSAAADLIPHILLNPSNTLTQPPLHLIIFPTYQSNAAFELRPLSKAQTGLALMQTLINARNLAGHGFAEAARLARVAPAYRLCYSSFDHFETQLNRLLAELQ